MPGKYLRPPMRSRIEFESNIAISPERVFATKVFPITGSRDRMNLRFGRNVPGPSVLKFAFGVGGDFGRGAITFRTGEHFTGRWSAPALFALEGRTSDSSWAARPRSSSSW